MHRGRRVLQLIATGLGVVGLLLLLVLLFTKEQIYRTDLLHASPTFDAGADVPDVDYGYETEDLSEVLDNEDEVIKAEEEFNSDLETHFEEDDTQQEDQSLVQEESDNVFENEDYEEVAIVESRIVDSEVIADYLRPGYESWYSTVSDRVNVPIEGLGDSTLFEDVFYPAQDHTKVFYMTYDTRFIVEDSAIAKVLYEEAYVYGQHELHPKVFEFHWDAEKQKFVFPSGVDAILMPGARISFDQETAKLKTLKEIPYYLQHGFTTTKLGESAASLIPEGERELLYSQQLDNFARLFVSTGTAFLDADGHVYIDGDAKVPISQFIVDVEELYKVRGLRTLGIKPVNGTAYKVVWDPYKNTYVFESGYEVHLSDGDRVAQLVLNDQYDIDGIRSAAYVDYGNHVSGCTRTRRLNAYQFDLPIPYGDGPYKTMLGNRGVIDGFLGQSKLPAQSSSWFLTYRNSRWDMMLDESTFPEGTNFVEVILHSDSPLGKIFGHGAVGIKYAGKRWLLDPYVRVPGYGEEELKEFTAWTQSDRARNHMGVARVYYYQTPVKIAGVSRAGVIEYFDALEKSDSLLSYVLSMKFLD